MKQAGTPSPYLPVVDKAGAITHLYYSQNAGHTFLEIFNGQASLNAAGRRQGYTSLGDLYELDPRPIVREKGLSVYREYDLNCKRQTVETEECPGAVPGTTKRRPVPLAEKWLPVEVIARRNGTSAVSVASWSAPELPDEPTAELATEPEEPKKAKRTKSG